MRIYPPETEEALHARKLLKEWTAEGILTGEQRERLQQETHSGLRTTNIFLRLVLFLFTLLGLAAAMGLCFLLFFDHSRGETGVGILCLIFAAASYAGAALAVSRFNVYRYGVEEALLVSSVGLLFVGWSMAGGESFAMHQPLASVIPTTCAVYALWIWHRFGLWYAFPAAMILVAMLPGYWNLPYASAHFVLYALYAAGLAAVIVIRLRDRLKLHNHDFSLAEAFLWLGVYLAMNLKLSALAFLAEGWRFGMVRSSQPTGTFYWVTWGLIWFLPMIILTHGIRRKDRFVIQTGALTVLLTLLTNKPYLGLPRHTWDPMLLGIFLAGAALFLRRWLSHGPGGVRHGFTVARLSEKEKRWLQAGSSIAGFAAPPTAHPQPADDFHFEGGRSGGGGAGGDF